MSQLEHVVGDAQTAFSWVCTAAFGGMLPCPGCSTGIFTLITAVVETEIYGLEIQVYVRPDQQSSLEPGDIVDLGYWATRPHIMGVRERRPD